ncbi:MAG: insulinase family protein [Oligoflexia bacterium]|nr:insulinase family protein [Oligoflexia bacterium]
MNRILLFFCIFMYACSTQNIAKNNGTSGASDSAEFYYLKDNNLPLLEIGVLIKEGASLDPMGKRGITALTLGTVLENEKLNEKANQVAVNFQSQISSDFILISADGLSKKRNQLLDCFSQLLYSPVWNQKVFELKKTRVLQSLRAVNDNSEVLADSALKLSLFGNHPYGIPVSGISQDVKKISLNDAKMFYANILSVPKPVFYVVGDFDDAFKAMFEERFKNWHKEKNISGYWPKPAAINNTEITFFLKRQSKQSKISIGQFGVSSKDPDEYKVKLALNILGGSYTSRLNKTLRSDKGYTYGAQSYLLSKKVDGYIQVETTTKPENTRAVINEAINAIKRFRDEGITELELEKAKQDMIMYLIKKNETPEGRIWFDLEQKLNDAKVETLNEKIDQIKSVSVSEINKIIKRYLNEDKYKIIVVGPEEILSDLNKIALVKVKEKLIY